MNTAKLLSLLGLAQKAGKLVSGEQAVEIAVRGGKAKLLIMAADCSANTKKSYTNMAAYYNVPLYETLTREDLGACIGKHHRAAIVVTDAGFSQALGKLLAVD